MDGELDFFLGELVGTTSNELVFDLRDRSLAPTRKWNGTNLRFGIGGHSDKGVDVVHGLPRRRLLCRRDSGRTVLNSLTASTVIVRRLPTPPIVRQKRPALMIPPAPANLEVPRRQPFPAEAQPLRQNKRPRIPRLNVGFEPMQP